MKKILIFVLFVFLFFQVIFGQDHIHWGSTNDPQNGLTIIWHSSDTSDQIKWGYTTNYEQGTFPGVRRNDYSGYLYDYTFPTVNSSSIIHYSIFSGGAWTSDKTFQTSVSPTSTHFSFIAGGDSRTNLNDWEIAAKKLVADSVDFHLFLGDHVNSGSSTTDWSNWYTRGADFLQKNLAYHTGGNHEYGSIYLNQFVMPGNEKWYSFEFGNALFICLLSQEDFSTQQTWLLNKLSTTTKTWKIVFFHKPFFTTGSHMTEMNSYRNTWWKAFDDYGVDVVLGGHTHYYLRSKPVNLNISTTSPVAEYGSNPGQGRLQIVAGSYGAPLTATGTGWFIEQNKSIMNYAKFEINDSVLTMNAYNMTGTLIDNVTIAKKTATGIRDLKTKIPDTFILNQNFPNPFNSSTTINYRLPKSNDVTLKIYNISAQEVATLHMGYQTAGDHEVRWTANASPSGLYFCRLQAGEYSDLIKLILQK